MSPSRSKPIRVLVVDDEPISRKVAREALSRAPGISVVGEAVDGVEAIALAEQRSPDVVVMDVNMPRMDGIEATRRITAAQDETGRPVVLMRTVLSAGPLSQQLLALGAAGYVLKDGGVDELVDAVRRVVTGHRYVSPDIAINHFFGALEFARAGLDQLSDREWQTLIGLANGKRLVDIAREASLSIKTIVTYRNRTLRKLGLKDDEELRVFARRHHLVVIDE